jgi:hypothetical protein
MKLNGIGISIYDRINRMGRIEIYESKKILRILLKVRLQFGG